jgi:hypothetical protein
VSRKLQRMIVNGLLTQRLDTVTPIFDAYAQPSLKKLRGLEDTKWFDIEPAKDKFERINLYLLEPTGREEAAPKKQRKPKKAKKAVHGDLGRHTPTLEAPPTPTHMSKKLPSQTFKLKASPMPAQEGGESTAPITARQQCAKSLGKNSKPNYHHG